MPSESSEKLYESQIMSFFKKSKFSPDDDFLKKHKEVIEEVKEFYQNHHTQKNIYNAIIIYGRKLNYPEKWLAYYALEIEKLNNIIKSQVNTNEKTDRQAENWISANEIKKIIEDLKKEIPQNVSTYPQYRSLMAFLAVYLQFNFPRRNDWATMKLVISEPTNKDFNYMVLGGSAKTSKFIFNQFKTVSKLGPQVFPIPENMFYTLKIYKPIIQSFSKDGFLFIRKDGEPLNTNEFTKFFTATMKQKTNKKVGTSLLRHIVISEKFSVDKDELAKRAQLALEMGHSISQQMQYAKSK